jgi:hypothetical protein
MEPTKGGGRKEGGFYGFLDGWRSTSAADKQRAITATAPQSLLVLLGAKEEKNKWE